MGLLGVAFSMLISCTLAAPTNLTAHALTQRSTPPLTVAGLLSIAPTSNSCAGAEFPTECRTAAAALPHILASFAAYRITHLAVQAALVSLMAYESGEFKYNVNHWPSPGVPGQGTRNMQSPLFNARYAASLGMGTPAQCADPAALMGLVGADEYSFASAAWFVTSQCPFAARRAMWSAGEEAWASYLENCVGASPAEAGRREYWERALRAFGL